MFVKLFAVFFSMSLLMSGCGGSSGDAGSQDKGSAETSSSSEEDSSQSSKWEEFLNAEVVEFSVSKADCSYDDGTLELLATFTNITSREILAIDASAEVQDLFGESIMKLNLSSDKPLASGKSVNVGSWGSSCFGLNEYDSDESRLMAMSNVSESTKIVISVNKIAFKDGEVLEF